MTVAYLSFGGNLGDPQTCFRTAAQTLADTEDCLILAKSSLYRTPPWGKTDQPDFLNAALVLDTYLSPLALLSLCQRLELAAGRQRKERWGARTLDVDIIAMEGIVRQDQPLVLPHPYYRKRLFVLIPLLEIVGDIALAPGEPSLSILKQYCEAEMPEKFYRIAGPESW